MRAISVLSLEAGMSTVVCDAWIPLRIRVRKSAMGSVIDMLLPAALRHAGDVAVVCELAQADAAHPELAEHRARAAAAAAAGVLARLELRTACLAHALRRLGHASGLLGSGFGWFLGGRGPAGDFGAAPLTGERHAERLEQRERLAVGLRRRGDRDVEAADGVDGVVVDLREDDLLADAHRVVAAAVERVGLQPAEVADPRDRDRHQPIEELVGALAAQRDRDADGHALAHLELRDRLAGATQVGLLPGDRRE